MSRLREFTCFTHLAQELQNLIWTFPFWPQVITFRVDHEAAIIRQKDNPNLVTLLSTSAKKWFELVDTHNPPAFAVCKASRAMALSKGYKEWCVPRVDGKSKRIL